MQIARVAACYKDRMLEAEKQQEVHLSLKINKAQVIQLILTEMLRKLRGRHARSRHVHVQRVVGRRDYDDCVGVRKII